MQPLIAGFKRFKHFFKKDDQLFILEQLKNFRPWVQFEIGSGDFIVRTAKCYSDLLKSFQLRQASFFDGALTESMDPASFEVDSYDLLADHILIMEKESGRLIGSYRVICSLFSRSFYSQGEFHMDEFVKSPGTKLELGRACIHPEYRNGQSIDLLWKGIGKYIQLTNPKYLFGCSSIKSMNPNIIQQVLGYLKNKAYSTEFHIVPTEEYRLDLPAIVHPVSQPGKDAKRLLPPLLRSYLNAGAEVHGIPALDREFGTVDFMTILNLEEIHPSFVRRYFDGEEPYHKNEAI